VIKSRRMRWAGHVARMGKRRGVCRVLVWKPAGKIPLGRPRRRWEDDIEMDLQEVVCQGMKSGSLNLLEPSGPQRACNGTPPYDPSSNCFSFQWVSWLALLPIF
jgi:hypothetical protein